MKLAAILATLTLTLLACGGEDQTSFNPAAEASVFRSGCGKLDAALQPLKQVSLKDRQNSLAGAIFRDALYEAARNPEYVAGKDRGDEKLISAFEELLWAPALDSFDLKRIVAAVEAASDRCQAAGAAVDFPTFRPLPEEPAPAPPAAAPARNSEAEEMLRDYLRFNFGQSGGETSWYRNIRGVVVRGDTATVRTDLRSSSDSKVDKICQAASGWIYSNHEGLFKNGAAYGVSALRVTSSIGKILASRDSEFDSC